MEIVDRKSSDSAAQLRLMPPLSADVALELDAQQRAVVEDAAGHGPLLLWGGPGTGKSTVVVEAAAHRVERDGLDPTEVLLLAPSRAAASSLREALSARLRRTLSGSPARSWAAYAFDFLRREHTEQALPSKPDAVRSVPRLISGAEQDLIIKELLEGHRLGLVRGPSWPVDFKLALPTRGFRQEVRQLFDRLVDYGLNPADLQQLAKRVQRPEWAAAADLFGEYRDLLELRAEGMFDPAGIVRETAERLVASTERRERERSRYQLILIDDLQEVGPAEHALLRALGPGKDLIATAAPDVVVQGFRGARPDLVSDLREELGAAEASLTTSHRMPSEIANAWRRVAERIAQRRGGHHARTLHQPERCDRRDWPGQDHEQSSGALPGGQIRSVLLASPIQERRFLAERILHFHIDQRRPFGQVAVIVRSGAQVAAIERYLRTQGIPVRVPVAETAVRDEPAVRPLLQAYRAVLNIGPDAMSPQGAEHPDGANCGTWAETGAPGLKVTPVLDAQEVSDLLTSCIGGMNSLQVRRLRRQLRADEWAAEGSRSSDELLTEAIWRPAQLVQLGVEGRAAARTARMLQAGLAAVREPKANPQTVLWALWQATGLSRVWAEEALRADALGSRADRDLDAMMALFESAERFVERAPAASPEAFLDYLLGQELPMDTLAPRGQAGDAVEVLTPASAAGRQWPIVMIAGLQEGSWPDTRLRGELLGSQQLVEVLDLGVVAARRMTLTQRMREIRYDELRSFSAALSRASEMVICTGALTEDEQPSAFLDLVDPYNPRESSGSSAQRPVTEVGRPKTLRCLVAELRQVLESRYTELPQRSGPGRRPPVSRATEPDAAEAALLLAALAGQGVPGASPEQWWGLAPLSSAEPIVPEDAAVSVSPSRIETALASPLNWFLQAAGGEVSRDLARSLGTLIHAIAQDLPEAGRDEYLDELERRWPQLGLPQNWLTEADHRRARRMLEKLADYLRLMATEQRRLLAVEPAFDVEVPGRRLARLRGRVDRLELDELGRLVVIDLKTGRTKPSKAAIAQHEQLGAYQVAVNHGAFDGLDGVPPESDSGGAALVQLGGDTRNVDEQYQPALQPEADWATPMIEEAAVIMSAAEFAAIHDPAKGERTGCPLPDVCPLCRGRQVTE